MESTSLCSFHIFHGITMVPWLYYMVVQDLGLPSNSRYIVSALDVVRTDGHSRSEEETRFLHFLGFCFEGLTKFCNQIH